MVVGTARNARQGQDVQAYIKRLLPTLAVITLWYYYLCLSEVGYPKNIGNSAIWKDKMP